MCSASKEPKRAALCIFILGLGLISAVEKSLAESADSASFLHGVNYYKDTEQNHRFAAVVGASLKKDEYVFSTELAIRDLENGVGAEDSEQATVSLLRSWSDTSSSSLELGAVSQSGEVSPIGSVQVDWKDERLRTHFILERNALYDTAKIVENNIRFFGAQWHAQVRLSERINPRMQLKLRDYSDDNNSLQLRGDIPYLLVDSLIDWEIAYRQEYLAFERQSGSGYFDPSELHAYQFVTSLSYWTQRFSAYGELYIGRQDARRFSNSTSDDFAGYYAEASVRDLGIFSVSVILEGSDYAVTTASGFQHYQVTVQLITTL